MGLPTRENFLQVYTESSNKSKVKNGFWWVKYDSSAQIFSGQKAPFKSADRVFPAKTFESVKVFSPKDLNFKAYILTPFKRKRQF